MTEPRNETSQSRPKWLRFLLIALSAWSSFALIEIVLFTLLWIIQVRIFDVEVEGLLAMIILVIQLLIGLYVGYRISKWQEAILELKPLKLNYIILILLILFSLLTLPAPLTYSIL